LLILPDLFALSDFHLFLFELSTPQLQQNTLICNLNFSNGSAEGGTYLCLSDKVFRTLGPYTNFGHAGHFCGIAAFRRLTSGVIAFKSYATSGMERLRQSTFFVHDQSSTHGSGQKRMGESGKLGGGQDITPR